MNETQTADALLRLPAVMQRVGLGKSSIYAMVAQGKFPQPVAIGPRARGWLASEISGFVEQCAQQRQFQPPRKTATAPDQSPEHQNLVTA